ncbi:hypothetical protein AYO39_02995 [Actinobacteria bacterium SCGC AG-212-D09]|nr:hypothetical protein AYO39_02995 [Actinobacteria bacterium SCGC AG-212-D09]
MWITRLALTAIFAGTGALAASAADQASSGCARRPNTADVPLPAPIAIATGDTLRPVSYRIGCDGRVFRVAKTKSPFAAPRDAVFEGNGGAWFAVRHNHLVIGRERTVLWRSHEQFSSPAHRQIEVGGLTVGKHTVAFTYRDTLYLAPLTGAERPIASGEIPLGFTTGGVYTYRWKRALLLRSDNGAVLKKIVRWPFQVNFFQVVGGNLYLIARSVLLRANGTRILRLAELRNLGLSASTWLQPIGHLVELEDNARLVVVRPDGSVFASTPLPRSDGEPDTISSFIAVAPHSAAVAFTAASGLADAPNTGHPGHGSETIYLLRPGAHAATPVHRELVEFPPCIGEGATLAWNGSWLLYDGADSHAAAIDTASPGRTVELRRIIRGLPGTRDGFAVYWSDQPLKGGVPGQ